jgi:bacterioferritin-associated ferredoxin
MYVCICNQVTDRDIRDAAHAGAKKLRDIQRDLGVASCCGKCAATAQCVLREAIAECNDAAPVFQLA